MGAYGSPEFLPKSSQNSQPYQSPQIPKSPKKKGTNGLKFLYAVLIIFSVFFAIAFLGEIQGNVAFSLSYLANAVFLAIACRMVHTNIDSRNVDNHHANARLHRKAVHSLKKTGMRVGSLTPEYVINYFLIHPIKTHSNGTIAATIFVPFIASIIVCSAFPSSSSTVPTAKSVTASSMQSSSQVNKAFVNSSNTPDSRKVQSSSQVENASGNISAYKASCKPYTYKQIARNPNQYMGKQAKVTGEVQQIEQANDGSEVILIAITKDPDADAWTNAIYATYTPKNDNESRILENDIITLYGTLDGIEDYTTVMGDTKSVPKLTAEYRDIKN